MKNDHLNKMISEKWINVRLIFDYDEKFPRACASHGSKLLKLSIITMS